jgi:hypothetical protein
MVDFLLRVDSVPMSLVLERGRSSGGGQSEIIRPQPKEEAFSMVENLVARLSLDDVRASVKRVQTEGRKFVTRLRKDATAIASRSPLDVFEDARKRAAKAARQLDAERTRIGSLVVERLSGLADRAVARAGLARAQEMADLKRRVSNLERRIERVTKAA